jgi:hypothetical protein
MVAGCLYGAGSGVLCTVAASIMGVKQTILCWVGHHATFLPGWTLIAAG